MNKEETLINILDEDSSVVNSKISLVSLEGSTVTITGASGLVGLNLVSSLNAYNKTAQKKISIIAVSHSKTDGATAKLFNNEGITEIFCDLSSHSSIQEIPFSDYIIHSAGYGQPGKFLDDKLKTLSINTLGTIELLKKLKPGGSFLFLSSSEVYSGHANTLNSEEDIGTTSPSHPRACYIEGKRSGEAIINIARETGIQAASARLALASGPGPKPDDVRVLNQLIYKGTKGEIDLLDDGSAIRTYGYISDVVVMLLNILISSNHSSYNVGGISALSIKELALRIGKKMDVPVLIPKKLSFMGDAPKTVGLDLGRIESEYKLKNYIDLDYGLEQTIKWIKANNE